ncbi:hypothetical protein [Prosthecobacter sp.]|uniref:hypothetical protein n=1 Tax=Prosthecobacter sp. TaxID=1965333 RepID=UPI002ABB239A|nr:hypothetical protein [Prosthecobacter sp.]MDZ4405062.1 hypothetical protein [Prosthecobacter sp.]
MKTLSHSLRGRGRRALTAFNPALPVDDSLVVAGELRDQFNGLKDLIDAIQTIHAAIVDGTNTLPTGTPAQVVLEVTDGTLHFIFGIPTGPQGEAGSNGSDGGQGPQGIQGEPGLPGAPGEVSLQQLTDAIATTSSNQPSGDAGNDGERSADAGGGAADREQDR